MSWRDRVAEIMENRAGGELTKPTKPPVAPLLSVLSVPAGACFPENRPSSGSEMKNAAASATSAPAASREALRPAASPERHSAAPGKPETLSGVLTNAERAELADLMNRYADANGFSDEDRDEALQTAIRFNWLDYLRQEVAKLPTPYSVPAGFKHLATFEQPTSVGRYAFTVDVPAGVGVGPEMFDILINHRGTEH